MESLLLTACGAGRLNLTSMNDKRDVTLELTGDAALCMVEFVQESDFKIRIDRSNNWNVSLGDISIEQVMRLLLDASNGRSPTYIVLYESFDIENHISETSCLYAGREIADAMYVAGEALSNTIYSEGYDTNCTIEQWTGKFKCNVFEVKL